MNHPSFFKTIVFAAAFFGMPGPVLIAQADGVSVETFHEEFRSNTGKEWIDATAEEKRSFVQDYYHKKEEAVREGKERLFYGGAEGGSGAPLSLESTLEVRQLFERKKKKSWEKATSEEQKVFLSEYEKEKEEQRQSQERQEEKKAREEEKQRQLKKMEKEKLKRLEDQKEREKLREEMRREKEREASREKLMDALDKFRKKRPGTQDRRHR